MLPLEDEAQETRVTADFHDPRLPGQFDLAKDLVHRDVAGPVDPQVLDGLLDGKDVGVDRAQVLELGQRRGVGTPLDLRDQAVDVPTGARAEVVDLDRRRLFSQRWQ